MPVIRGIERRLLGQRAEALLHLFRGLADVGFRVAARA